MVVLPAPWRPTSAMIAGLPCSRNWRSPAPSSSTSSSWTIFTICWPAVRLPRISVPTARSRIRPTTSLTTLKLTSASSRASRISRAAASTSASLIRPLPVRLASVFRSRSLRLSNTCGDGSHRDPVEPARRSVADRERGFWRAGVGSVARSALDRERDADLVRAVLDEEVEPARHARWDLEPREEVLLRLPRPDQLDRLAVAVAARADDLAVGEAERDVVAREREAAGEAAEIARVVGEGQRLEAGDELL